MCLCEFQCAYDHFFFLNRFSCFENRSLDSILVGLVHWNRNRKAIACVFFIHKNDLMSSSLMVHFNYTSIISIDFYLCFPLYISFRLIRFISAQNRKWIDFYYNSTVAFFLKTKLTKIYTREGPPFASFHSVI